MFKTVLVIAASGLGLGVALSHGTVEQRARLLAVVEDDLGFRTSDLAATRDLRPAGVDRPRPDRIGFGASTAIDGNRLGQYETTMQVAGRNLPVLVDTGASFVVLTYEDAASIGLHPTAADFRYAMKTANGMAQGAGAVVPSIRVGNVEARDVAVVISSPWALTERSLLGMSFLRKLSGFQVASGRLVLNQ